MARPAVGSRASGGPGGDGVPGARPAPLADGGAGGARRAGLAAPSPASSGWPTREERTRRPALSPRAAVGSAAGPYATLAPYFARLFRPRGIRGWFEAARALVAAAGVRGGRQLDVGAGTCRYSRYWARAGFRTVCLDVLHPMLARARLAGTGGRLHRVCGTIDCLREGAGFDLATAIDDVVAYVGAQPGGLEAFLPALGARLRPGGLFLLDFITPAGRRRYTFRNSCRTEAGRIVADSRGRFDATAGQLIVELTLEAPDRVVQEHHVLRLYSPEEMEALLRRAGFEVVAVTDLYDGPGVGYRPGQPSYDLLARWVGARGCSAG